MASSTPSIASSRSAATFASGTPVSGAPVSDSVFAEVRMESVLIPPWSRAADRTLGQLSPAQNHGVQVAGVHRGGLRILNPNAQEKLQAGDEILVLGGVQAVAAMALGTQSIDAVDMFVEVQLLRSMAVLATVNADASDDVLRRRSVSAAKAKLGTAGRFVSQQAIQLHGGIGITDEHDIGLYFKRMLALNAVLGDEPHHVQRLAALPGFAG